jgi:hypothetical protein
VTHDLLWPVLQKETGAFDETLTQLSQALCIYDLAIYDLLFIYDLVIWLFYGCGCANK